MANTVEAVDALLDALAEQARRDRDALIAGLGEIGR